MSTSQQDDASHRASRQKLRIHQSPPHVASKLQSEQASSAPHFTSSPRSFLSRKPIQEQETAPQDNGAVGLNLNFAHTPTSPSPPIQPVQFKLTVNAPNDRFEVEADRMADTVMRMPADLSATSARGTPGIQLMVAQRLASAEPAAVTSDTERAIEGMAGGGNQLPASERAFFEERMGADFSHVRVHTDTTAAQTSHDLNARAFTVGNNIAFNSGEYSPGSSEGRRLLAHELTHVIQQGQASPRQGTEAFQSAEVQTAALPGIQRDAVWQAGAVHEVNNLANSLLHGTPVGVTFPTLNGSTLRSAAAAKAAFASPTLAFTAVASGIEARVDAVPVNTGSFDETVLAQGPWTLTVPKVDIANRIPSLLACAAVGNTTFRAIGQPSDAAMFAANRRHEDRHAADHQVAFNEIIVPWDTRLKAAKASNQAFQGATQAEAEAALYTSMGGTPDEIAERFFVRCLALGRQFHNTPQGGAVSFSNPQADATCATSSVDGTNPG